MEKHIRAKVAISLTDIGQHEGEQDIGKLTGKDCVSQQR